MESEHLLVATDLSASSMPAVKTAARLATRLHARVTLVSVLEARLPLSAPRAPLRSVQPLEPRRVQRQLGYLRARWFGGVDADIEVIEGARSVALGIVDAAVRCGASMIIMGTHGRTGIQRLVHGSNAHKVARFAPCDVLTVHSVNAAKPPSAGQAKSDSLGLERMSTMLCAVDFDEASKDVLDRALFLARSLDAELHLLHVFPPPDDGQHARDPAEIELATAELHRLVTERPDPLPVETHFAEGRAEERIVELASSLGAELVIVGRRPRPALRRRVSDRVLARAPGAVLTVPAHSPRARLRSARRIPRHVIL